MYQVTVVLPPEPSLCDSECSTWSGVRIRVRARVRVRVRVRARARA